MHCSPRVHKEMKKRNAFLTRRKAAMATVLSAVLIIAVISFLVFSNSVKAQQSETNGNNGNCGDGTCIGGENCTNCPSDCGSCDNTRCGNGVCDGGELCTTCPSDCGACPAATEANSNIIQIVVGTFGVVFLIIIVIFVFIYFIFKRWKNRDEQFGKSKGTYGDRPEQEAEATPVETSPGWTIANLGDTKEGNREGPGKEI